MPFARYKGIFIVVQAFLLFEPILAGWFDFKEVVAFPPLGDADGTWLFMSMLLTAVAAVVPYLLHRHKWKWALIGCGVAVLFAIAACTHLYFSDAFVESIGVTGQATRYVVRGSVRQPSLKEPFRSMSDRDLIKNAGQRDEDLELVYTRDSLDADRAKLFISFTSSLMLLEVLVGCIALVDVQAERTEH